VVIKLSIGDNIRKFRNAKGISQKELGRISGTSETTVRQYEGEKRTPRIEQIELIAKALDVTPVQLMGTVYWDSKRPALSKEAAQYEAFVAFLESLDYVVEELAVHETIPAALVPEEFREDDIDIDGESFEFRMSREKKNITFTEAEFEELQKLTKEVIESKFYKKLLDSKK
jgi:transcriptional regulator with XRE-family HTH domain